MSKWKITTVSAEQTEEFGESIGRQLKGGEIIELASDLGGGKTTLTKGIAIGLGIKENITSPTFLLSKVYTSSELELHHYDFYRLLGSHEVPAPSESLLPDSPGRKSPREQSSKLGTMRNELQEVLENVHNVTVLEWASNSRDLFPVDRLIRVELLPQIDENTRDIVMNVPDGLNYVVLQTGAEKC